METITESQFKKKVLQSQTPVLLEFYKDDCKYCDEMVPIITQIEQQYGHQLSFVKINAERNPKLAAKYATKYNIETAPAFFIFKNGQIISGPKESMTQKEMTSWIKTALLHTSEAPHPL